MRTIPHIRFGLSGYCTYCGGTPECMDHVIPISSYTENRKKRHSSEGIQTFACNRCNLILGCNVFPTFQERVLFVVDELKFKHKRFGKLIQWSDEEINELNDELRSRIVKIQEKREETNSYANWLISTNFNRILQQFTKLDLIDPSSPLYVEWLAAYFQFNITSVFGGFHQGA